MNKMLTTIFALAVASVTLLATPLAQAQEVKGNAKAAEAKIAMCIGCHGIKGYQASFPEVHKVPMISGQSAKYIVAALNEYKKGERKHPTMRGIADTLTDQDMADIGAYYSTHGGTSPALPDQPSKTPSTEVAALLTKGACVSCHGTNFSKPIDVYPKIAGQHADYMFVALKAYKASEKNALVGRSNGIMGGVAKQFTNNELKALAGYISTLDSELKTVPESRFR
ncbi:MAG: cytochrome c4 [Comamonadaceae bacterium]|nr:MAG: cytochrome c4 [Comamonadaceae bacterium]